MNDIGKLANEHDQLNGIDVESLKRAELGAALSFEEVFKDLKASYDLLYSLSSQKEVLGKDPLVPQALIDTLGERIQRFRKLAARINEFDFKASDAYNNRQNLSAEIVAFRKELVNHLYPLVTLLQVRQIDPDRYHTSIESTRAEVETTLKHLKEKDEEASKALQGIKDLSATAGAVKYSSVFEDQAKKHKDVAWSWFIAGCAVFLLLGGYLTYLLFHGLPVTTEIIQTIRDLSVRVLFLAVLYFSLIQCVKNYNINKHLQVVNEHRQNSLQTFEAFVSAAATDDVKGAVLLEATKSIFDPGKTGYLQKEGQVSYSFSVADIFKKS